MASKKKWKRTAKAYKIRLGAAETELNRVREGWHTAAKESDYFRELANNAFGPVMTPEAKADTEAAFQRGVLHAQSLGVEPQRPSVPLVRLVQPMQALSVAEEAIRNAAAQMAALVEDDDDDDEKPL